jgi:N-acetylmuramoyl-L-alanine amidase
MAVIGTAIFPYGTIYAESPPESEPHIVSVDNPSMEGVMEGDADMVIPGVEGLIPSTLDALGLDSSGITVQSLVPYAGGTVVIALDPGHDNTHAGAHANGLAEEALNIRAAYACKRALETYSGVRIYMTRSENGTCPYPGTTSGNCNLKRVEAAKAQGANFLISFHFNAGSGTADGAMVLVPNPNYNTRVYQEGNLLANRILSALAAKGLRNRGPYRKDSTDNSRYPDGSLADWYQMVREPKLRNMTGIIIEHAFMDNAGDAAKLKQANFVESLGVADAGAIAGALGLSNASVVSVPQKNDFQGTFTAQVNSMGNYANLQAVKFAVWSDANGQDDLIWYNGVSKGNGVYTVDVNIKNHKNDVGKYSIHAYATTNAGSQIINTANTVLYRSSAVVDASHADASEMKENLRATLTNPPPELSAVRFAVWSDANGQDDLIWYNGTQSGNQWTTDADITRHKTAGKYQVHVYGTFAGGYQGFIGAATSFNITSPTATSIDVESLSDGTYKLTLSGAQALGGVTKVEFPVWSNANKQSDIFWYPGTGGSGTYTAIVRLGNHQFHLGDYTVHAYVTGANQVRSMVKGGSFATGNLKTTVSAKLDGAEKTANMGISGLDAYGSVSAVTFAVWSAENGQDDLKWYTGTKSGGQWISSANILNHKSTGTYYVHVYATLNGKSGFAGSGSFTVTPNTADALQIESQPDGTYKVTLSGVKTKSGVVTKVEFPIWSKGDQSDIHWYTATKNSDGSYSSTVQLANHKYNTGTYSVHAYVTSDKPLRNMAKANTFSVSTPSVRVVATESAKPERAFRMTATNVGLKGTATKVQFAVWSDANSQDDLIWYNASKSGDQWIATADITRHKTAGKYQVHVYATIGGKGVMIGSTTFSVTAPTAASLDITPQSDGTYKLTLTGMQALGGVTKVELPVWSDSKQGNIFWYPATLASDGTTATATVRLGNHGFLLGNYTVHAYVTGANQVRTLVKGASFTVNGLKTVAKAEDTGKTEKNISLSIDGLDAYGTVTKTQFAVWSLDGGQNDLIWYNGTKSGSKWIATADIARHKTAGTYAVHVYATVGGKASFVSAATFSITRNSASKIEVTDHKNGTYTVKLTGVNAPSGVSKVQFPVWQRADQSDIFWYTATGSGGTYTAKIDVKNHQYHWGTYNVHTYVLSGNQISTMVQSATFTANSSDFQYDTSDMYRIMGASTVTVNQMVAWYNSKGRAYPAAALAKGGAGDIRTFCTILLQEANAEGVRAEVVFAQSMKETGWLGFGGAVKVEQFNFAGIGAVDSDPRGSSAWFPDVRTGLRAQVQHLKAYGSSAALVNGCVDPRFSLVTRNCAPYVQWLGQQENPSGKGWATAKNYGYDIMSMILQLKSC